MDVAIKFGRKVRAFAAWNHVRSRVTTTCAVHHGAHLLERDRWRLAQGASVRDTSSGWTSRLTRSYGSFITPKASALSLARRLSPPATPPRARPSFSRSPTRTRARPSPCAARSTASRLRTTASPPRSASACSRSRARSCTAASLTTVPIRSRARRRRRWSSRLSS